MTHQLLFIDDIEVDGEIACWYIRQAGINCDYRVVDTEQGLRQAVADLVPQMILADIVMPQFDGWHALRVCRELAAEVPFVLYSGTISVEDARLAMMRGVFGAVEKDSPQQLVSVVRRALGLL